MVKEGGRRRVLFDGSVSCWSVDGVLFFLFTIHLYDHLFIMILTS